MKNSNDTIVNRSRELLVCSAVTQPTAPPRTPNQRWNHLIQRKQRLHKLCSCKHWHEKVDSVCDMITSTPNTIILTTNVNPPEMKIWFDCTRTACKERGQSNVWQRRTKHLSVLGAQLCVMHTIMVQPVIFVHAFSFPPPPSLKLCFFYMQTFS
jgi:hypothetical protein